MEGVSIVRKDVPTPASMSPKKNVSTSFLCGDSLSDFEVKAEDKFLDRFTDEDRDMFIFFGFMSCGLTVGIYLLAKAVISFYHCINRQELANEAEKNKAKNCLSALRTCAELELKKHEFTDNERQEIEFGFNAVDGTPYQVRLLQDFYEGHLHVGCSINGQEATWSPMPMKLKELADTFDPDFSMFKQFQKNYIENALRLGLLERGTIATRLCQSMTLREVKNEAHSMQPITAPSYQLLDRLKKDIVCQRDVVHIPSNLQLMHDKAANMQLLHTEGSMIRFGGEGIINQYVAPGNQVSLLQQTTLLLEGQKKHPHVLSVPVPMLDDVDKMPVPSTALTSFVDLKKSQNIDALRAETEHYLELSDPPRLIKEEYQKAYDTLSKHIVRAAQQCDAPRVVLSAYGMNAAIKALQHCDVAYDHTDKKTNLEDTAQEIAVHYFVLTVLELRRQGREVYFYDPDYGADLFLDQVNDNLMKAFQSQVHPVNRPKGIRASEPDHLVTYRDNRLHTDEFEIEDHDRNSMQEEYSEHAPMADSADWSWVQDTDLIVCAWNSDSLVGNAMLLDSSMEARLAVVSSLNFVHAWEAYQHNMRAKNVI